MWSLSKAINFAFKAEHQMNRANRGPMLCHYTRYTHTSTIEENKPVGSNTKISAHPTNTNYLRQGNMGNKGYS